MSDGPERKRCSLAGFVVRSVGIEVERSDVGMCGTQVRVMLLVDHDATGLRCGPMHVTAASMVVHGPSLTTDDLRILAKEALHNAFDHEIDEWLRIDGVLADVEHPRKRQ